MKLEAKQRLQLTALSTDKVKLSPQAVVKLAQAYVTESNRLLKILNYLCYQMDVGEPEQDMMDGKAVRALAVSMLKFGGNKWWMTLHKPLLNTLGLNKEQLQFVERKLEPAFESGQKRLYKLFDQCSKPTVYAEWATGDDGDTFTGMEPTTENLDLNMQNEEPIYDDAMGIGAELATDEIPKDGYLTQQQCGPLGAKARLRSTE